MRLAHFDVILETLTPLHIGTGEEWQVDADFVVEEGRNGERFARLIDVGAALLDMTPEEIASIREGRIAAAIGERGRERHTIALLPVRGPGNVTRTRALQRLSDGRPYIPGTTVKGSIRTALLRALAAQDAIARLPGGETRDPRRAAAHIEEGAFGVALGGGERPPQFPNRDLNRLIRVSDFLPQGDVPVAFVNMSAHRLGEAPLRQRAAPIPIWCEAIEPGAKFQGTITVEVRSPLWDAMSEAQRARVERPFYTWSQAGRRLLEIERDAWQRGPEAVRTSVLEFLDGALARNEITVNLGWGGGWRSKTLADRIPTDRLRAIAERYGLNRWKGRDFPERFPVTRKVAWTAKDPLPPGWVRVLRRRQGGEG